MILFFKLILDFLQFFWTQMEPLADVEFCKFLCDEVFLEAKFLGSATWLLRIPTNFEMKNLTA